MIYNATRKEEIQIEDVKLKFDKVFFEFCKHAIPFKLEVVNGEFIFIVEDGNAEVKQLIDSAMVKQ